MPSDRISNKDWVSELGRMLDKAGVKIKFGLLQQGHLETVRKMRADCKPWSEIGAAIGWKGEAVQHCYEIETTAELLAAREELKAARAVIEAQRCYCSVGDWEPICPICNHELKRVRYPGGYLNEEQFDAVRAGDWYCTNCKGAESNTGYKYWWSRDIENTPGNAKPIQQCTRCDYLARYPKEGRDGKK